MPSKERYEHLKRERDKDKNPYKPFPSTTKKVNKDYLKKPTTNRIDNQIRIPRPLGLTRLCEAYNKAQDNLPQAPQDPIQPKTRNQLQKDITNLIMNNYTMNILYYIDYDEYGTGRCRLYSSHEVSIMLGITESRLLDKVILRASKRGELGDRERDLEFTRAMGKNSFFKSLNHGLKAEKWLDTLMALGMARNMPIGIIKELNAAFNMVNGMTKLQLEALKSIAPNAQQIGSSQSIKIGIQNGAQLPTQDGQYLDTTSAVALLNQNGQNIINEDAFRAVYLTEGLDQVPNVIAVESDAQMSIVKNKVFSDHETRRQDELGTFAEFEVLPNED